MGQPVVIITGGGRGIGRAIAQCFGRDGAAVVVAARSASELEQTRAGVQALGGECLVRVTDVTDIDDLQGLVEESRARFSRVDMLVNCAGVAPHCALEELNQELFDVIHAVNVRAVYTGCRAVWPVMRAQKGGVIVTISSIASVDPFPGFAAYGAAKAWVNAWTRGLAEEGRAWGIRVYAVAPGAVETKMLRDAFPDFPADQTLAAEEVAEVVHALAQPACRSATGQTVFVRK